MDNISISLSEGSSNGVSEIRVDGVIDTITAPQLEEVIDSLLKRERHRLIIDLAGVDYISSAGWGIFISHIRQIRDADGDIVLSGMIPNVLEIYELLEFDNVLKAFDSIEQARDQFGEGGSDHSKKKARRPTRVTVNDKVGACSSIRPSAEKEQVLLSASDPETAVLRQVKSDPFASIREIKAELNSGHNPIKLGWWTIHRILRKRGLRTRRSRFRYARGRL